MIKIYVFVFNCLCIKYVRTSKAKFEIREKIIKKEQTKVVDIWFLYFAHNCFCFVKDVNHPV